MARRPTTEVARPDPLFLLSQGVHTPVSFSDWLPTISTPHLIFSGAALVVIVLIWLFLSRIIGQRMTARLERLESLDHFDAVPTSSPYNEPQVKARAAARRNVRTRYTVLRNMFAVAAFALVVLFLLLPVLGDIPRAFLSFLVAVTLAIVGIAARPLVENLISGVVISLSNQMRIGDTVLLDEDYYGTIEDINITHTVVKLWDWRRYIVPNSRMLQKEVISLTTKDTFLWAYVSFHVSARADLSLVERIAEEAALQSQYNAGFEVPQVWIREMNPGYVTCWLAAWAKTPEDAWSLRSDMRRGLAEGLRAHGIETHMDFHSLVGTPDAPWTGREGRRAPPPSNYPAGSSKRSL